MEPVGQFLRRQREARGMSLEEIARANDTDPGRVYAQLQKAGRLEAIERELTERAVFDFLKGQSEIIEAQGA